MFKLYGLRDAASKKFYYSQSLTVTGDDPMHAWTSKDRSSALHGMMGGFLTWPGPPDRPKMPELVEFEVRVVGEEPVPMPPPPVVIEVQGPVPMLLWCPECGDRHVDVGEFATKVHHTHSCQSCGHVWRPALVATVGVQFLPGFKNAEPPKPSVRRDVFIRWQPDGHYLARVPGPMATAHWVKYPAGARTFTSKEVAQGIIDSYGPIWRDFAFVEEI